MISIASWNVNSIRARLPALEKWIKTHTKPDILLLQETKVEDQHFPIEFFEDLSYNISVFGQKSYNGVAIASLFPIEDVKRHSFAGLDHQARCLEIFTKDMRILSVYVPNGQSVGTPAYQAKLLFLDELRAYLKKILAFDEKICVGGDFNVAAYDEDVYDAVKWKDSILCSEPERQHFRHILHDGWIDAMPTISGTLSEFTWWDYKRRAFENDAGLKIDYFLLSPLAAQAKKSARVLKSIRGFEKPSDHAPLLLSLSY